MRDLKEWTLLIAMLSLAGLAIWLVPTRKDDPCFQRSDQACEAFWRGGR